MIPWRAKKQIFILAFILVVAVAAGIVVFNSISSPTCFDNKLNQDEEDVDCGGPCEPCLGEIRELIVVWSKTFKLKDGQYNAAALISNPNLFLGINSFRYQFKLYDDKNILVAVREGETFINPDEKYVVFESNIDTGNREPKRATIEFEKNINWKRIEEEKPQLVITKKQFINLPFPRLVASVSNKSIFPISDVSAAAVLYNEEKNARAVSSTFIDYLGGGASRDIVFTWPEPFLEEPASDEIYLRADLTK